MPRYPEITPEEMKEFEDSATGRLRVPDTARNAKKNVKNRDTGERQTVMTKRWRESAEIEAVTVVTTDTNAGDTHDVYKITYSITATKGSGKNVGRKAFANLRFNADAYEARNKDDGQFKMSRGTMISLTQIVRSAGFDISGGLSSAGFAAYFPEGDESPLVGREVEIELDQYEDEGAPSGWRDDVNNVFPLRMSAASAEV